MMEIKALEALSREDYLRIMGGYTSTQKYRVRREDTLERITITLELVQLEQAYRRNWGLDEGLGFERYETILAEGLSLGAYDGETLVGLAIGERHDWNRSLWIWEFGVDERYRRQGIGRRLMDAMADLGKKAGMRCLLIETQNTNVPAIMFYRAVGLEIEAVDLSYYTNNDITDFEVAIFMRRKVEEAKEAIHD